uniref:Uncharacterized protein n=1 Tax=Sphaerodactylus townsendi TaxID=933632 RepID=A0ACB8FHJ3_9SAUR
MDKQFGAEKILPVKGNEVSVLQPANSFREGESSDGFLGEQVIVCCDILCAFSFSHVNSYQKSTQVFRSSPPKEITAATRTSRNEEFHDYENTCLYVHAFLHCHCVFK